MKNKDKFRADLLKSHLSEKDDGSIILDISLENPSKPLLDEDIRDVDLYQLLNDCLNEVIPWEKYRIPSFVDNLPRVSASPLHIRNAIAMILTDFVNRRKGSDDFVCIRGDLKENIAILSLEDGGYAPASVDLKWWLKGFNLIIEELAGFARVNYELTESGVKYEIELLRA